MVSDNKEYIWKVVVYIEELTGHGMLVCDCYTVKEYFETLERAIYFAEHGAIKNEFERVKRAEIYAYEINGKRKLERKQKVKEEIVKKPYWVWE